MKLRIKFLKTGTMKFVGHLDLMRFFQKAVRRADIGIKYSEGFSPHQIMSFAAPLSLGIESYAEYMDIEIEDEAFLSGGTKLIKTKLQQCMCEGLDIVSVIELDLAKSNKAAMSLVDAADYQMILSEDIEFDKLSKELKKFIDKENILVEKKSKDSIKEVDIKPGIRKLYALEDKQGKIIFMHLAQGSEYNLKPELVIDAMKLYTGLKLSGYRLIRTEIYAKEEKRLDEYGR